MSCDGLLFSSSQAILVLWVSCLHTLASVELSLCNKDIKHCFLCHFLWSEELDFNDINVSASGILWAVKVNKSPYLNVFLVEKYE